MRLAGPNSSLAGNVANSRGICLSYELTPLVVFGKMSTTLDKELQERLREASAIGDVEEVRSLVESGVNVNSQNEINGW